MRRRLLLVMAMGSTLLAMVARAADDPVQEIQDLTLQWTGLEHQKDLLQASWREGKPVLEQQLSLLEREAKKLNDVLEASTNEQDEGEKRRQELLKEQTQFEQEQTTLDETLERAATELSALQPQLPPPLLEAWSADLPRLGDSHLTATEKLQLVLKLLGQLDDFERKVTVNETVMTLADGQDYLVKQVYLGLSHGWYITADGRFAAAGMATRDGWQWTPISDGTPITEIVGILERRVTPRLVSVPVQLNGQGLQGNN